MRRSRHHHSSFLIPHFTSLLDSQLLAACHLQLGTGNRQLATGNSVPHRVPEPENVPGADQDVVRRLSDGGLDLRIKIIAGPDGVFVKKHLQARFGQIIVQRPGDLFAVAVPVGDKNVKKPQDSEIMNPATFSFRTSSAKRDQTRVIFRTSIWPGASQISLPWIEPGRPFLSNSPLSSSPFL